MSASEAPVASNVTFAFGYLFLKSCQKISASYPDQSKTDIEPVTVGSGFVSLMDGAGVAVGPGVEVATATWVGGGFVGAFEAPGPAQAATRLITLTATPARSRVGKRPGCIHSSSSASARDGRQGTARCSCTSASCVHPRNSGLVRQRLLKLYFSRDGDETEHGDTGSARDGWRDVHHRGVLGRADPHAPARPARDAARARRAGGGDRELPVPGGAGGRVAIDRVGPAHRARPRHVHSGALRGR